MNSSILERLAIVLAVVFCTALLAACGSSGSSSQANLPGGCVPSDASTSSECGTVLVAVTDAEGDFISYTVDILSLSLDRGNGGSSEMLPTKARVDFAELTEIAEILSATTLVPGNIVGGTIRLDYSNAEVFVEAGGEIVAADLVDMHGAPLGVVDLEIRLAERDHFVITRGRSAFLSLDFDLAISHEVDTSQSPPRVTAMPYIVAEIEPVESKELRLRGTLVAVDVENSSYDIRIRPWHRRDGDHGRVTVHTTGTTSFEIGESIYTGEAGLLALAELDRGTLTVAFGSLSVAERRFTAEIVHARDSVGGDGIDAVYGNVVARDDDQLIVRGALVVHRDRPARFRHTVIVDVGPDTKVFKVARHDTMLDEKDISVGQRIVAFGQLADNDLVASSDTAPDIALLLDATQGRVRMLVTRLHGSITSIDPGVQMTMKLRAIDRLAVEHYDFTGTGMTPDLDADPQHYEIATGSLSLEALAVDKWTRVHGFVSRWQAGPPDFEALTVVDHRDIPAALGIGWGVDGTAAPFVHMGPDSLVADLENLDIDDRHHMLLGRRLVDLFDLPHSPVIAPSDERSLYGIWEAGHIELFASFPEFVDELGLRLSNSDTARSIAAFGQYDESENSVTARRIAVHMIAAE